MVEPVFFESLQNVLTQLALQFPQKYIGHKLGDLLLFHNPLYSIRNAGDCWNATSFDFVKNDLSMIPLDGDATL